MWKNVLLLKLSKIISLLASLFIKTFQTFPDMSQIQCPIKSILEESNLILDIASSLLVGFSLSDNILR